MGKYSNIDSDIFSIFDSAAWKRNNIKTVPVNFTTKTTEEFLRVSILPSGPGVNRNSASGIVIVEIYTPAGQGPKRITTLADLLDTFMANKSLKTVGNNVTQFQTSSLSFLGSDSVNPALARANYSIPFNFYGVQ